MKLRFRGPNQAAAIPLDIPDEIPLNMLPMMLEETFNVPSDRIVLAVGFPPKPLGSVAEDATVASVFKEGDMVIVREGDDAILKRGRTDGRYVKPCDERSTMRRIEVPADNSCLFHAVAKVADQPGLNAATLRSRCVETVLANQAKFNATLLGQRPEHYALWLAQPSSWGGAVELVILAFLLQIEIVVVDIQAGRTETFGAGEGYVTRGFVLYTGKHYDALAMVSAMNGNREQFIFNCRDQRPMEAAKDMSLSAKTS